MFAFPEYTMINIQKNSTNGQKRGDEAKSCNSQAAGRSASVLLDKESNAAAVTKMLSSQRKRIEDSSEKY
jgi:hypothetical protein